MHIFRQDCRSHRDRRGCNGNRLFSRYSNTMFQPSSLHPSFLHPQPPNEWLNWRVTIPWLLLSTKLVQTSNNNNLVLVENVICCLIWQRCFCIYSFTGILPRPLTKPANLASVQPISKSQDSILLPLPYCRRNTVGAVVAALQFRFNEYPFESPNHGSCPVPSCPVPCPFSHPPYVCNFSGVIIWHLRDRYT